jgi:hypothetical protein
MSYVSLGETPAEVFARRMAELRSGVTDTTNIPKSTINWWCWDAPGFKACHDGPAFRAAQADCEAQGHKDDTKCIVPLADHYSLACPCPTSAPASARLLSGMSGNTLLIAGLVLAGAYVMFWPTKKATAV